MDKPRVVIIDYDFSYIIPLQSKFIYEFLEDIEIEIITEEEYCKSFFENMRKIDVLILSQEIYSDEFQKHDITHIFVMAEEQETDMSVPDNVHIIYKYTSVKGIFLEIVGISNLKIPMKDKKEDSKIVIVTSATGGTGKTTIALGIASALSDMYKRVLYIEASRLQTFQQYMYDASPIINQGIYTKMTNPSRAIYSEIKGELRKQKFTYVPPFKAALMSFGIDYNIFGMIAKSAKESGEYDYIVIDTDVAFDEAKAKMFNVSDMVIVVSEYTRNSIFSTSRLAVNINNSSSDKYLFVCNKYRKNRQSILDDLETMQYKIDEYIEYFDEYENMTCEEFGMRDSIRNIAFLLI